MDIGKFVFKYRGYTPIPFLIVMLIFAESTIESMIGGFLLVMVGEFFRFWGICYAGAETRTTGRVGGSYLIISGAFAYVRNPLYLGNIITYLGIGIMSMALFPYLQIIALIYFYMQYYLIINEEEGYLKETFSKYYEEYLKAVPRLIPRFTPYKNSDVEQPPLNIKGAVRSERRTLQAITSVVLLLVIRFIIG